MNDKPTPLARIVIDKEIYEALKLLHDRDGVTPTESTRRALREYLEKRIWQWEKAVVLRKALTGE